MAAHRWPLWRGVQAFMEASGEAGVVLAVSGTNLARGVAPAPPNFALCALSALEKFSLSHSKGLERLHSAAHSLGVHLGAEQRNACSTFRRLHWPTTHSHRRVLLHA